MPWTIALERAGYVAAGFAAYAVASRVLRSNPQWIHRRQHLWGGPYPDDGFQIIAHRGGSGEGPENALPAFKRAAFGPSKSDILEMDVRLTQDGQVVVFHDGTMNRVCDTGPNASVGDYTYDTLPRLAVGPHLPGEETPARIPLLRDVFAACPDMPMNVDLKDNSPELVRKVHALVVEYKREAITCWGSMHRQTHRQCRATDPQIPTFFTILGVVKLYLYWVTGLLPFIPLTEHFLYLPTHIPTPYFTINLCRPKLFDHLRQRGISVVLFGMNGALDTEDQWERAIAAHATGICTNFPQRLREYLNERRTHGEMTPLIRGVGQN